MTDYTQTTRVRAINLDDTVCKLTIFESKDFAKTRELSASEKSIYSWGRDITNDIVLSSKLVSRKHGNFQYENNQWSVVDLGSTNGIIHNGVEVEQATLAPDDFIRIDDGIETVKEGVLMIVPSAEYSSTWETISVSEIGASYELCSDRPSASMVIEKNGSTFFLTVSDAEVLVNKESVSGRVQLHEKDFISCGNLRVMFTTDMLHINRLRTSASHSTFLQDDEIQEAVESVAENVENHDIVPCSDNHDDSPSMNVIYETSNNESNHEYFSEDNQQTSYDNQTNYNSQGEYQYNNATPTSGRGFRNFLASPAGYYVMSFVIALIIWGITIALWTSQGELALIVILACAFFGWQALNSIQPAMFIWMSWTGWIIYFCVKFILSAIIGLFVAPFKLGKWIAGVISESLM